MKEVGLPLLVQASLPLFPPFPGQGRAGGFLFSLSFPPLRSYSLRASFSGFCAGIPLLVGARVGLQETTHGNLSFTTVPSLFFFQRPAGAYFNTTNFLPKRSPLSPLLFRRATSSTFPRAR